MLNVPLFMIFAHNEYTSIYDFRTWSREIIDRFSRFEKILTLSFSLTLLKQDLSNFA